MRAEGRVRAPELRGAGGWLNTGGRELSLAGLRGRIVLLDFWTSACANCLHVIDELRPLEARYADVLTTIGVHSPKFPHEAEHAAVVTAVQRYDVRHPVLDDPDLTTWRQYAIDAWPTLVLVDPDGYVVATRRGERHAAEFARLIDGLIDRYGDRLQRGDAAYVQPEPAASTLRFPGGVAVTPADTLLVADAGHHSVVELAADGETLLRRIGSGQRGRADGAPDDASFAEPQGVAVLPPGAIPGVDVLVADTANHLIRGVRLATGEVSTVADLPAALAGVATVTGPVPGVLSPWDVAWWDGRIAVAAAGVHLLLAVNPAGGGVEVVAGTTVEGLRDGPALDGWLAQPSGLAADGARLWFVDAETSSLRSLAGGTLSTHVGEGLFDYGLVDGPAGQARFQHPLGVTLLPDGTVAVLDTYNGAVRRFDPRSRTVDTLATGLAEPTGAVVRGDELVVVESAAHRLTRIPLRRTVEVGPGEVTVTVTFVPPPGEKLDDRYGSSTSLKITGLGTGPSLGPELTRTVTIDGETRVQVSAYAASCDEDAEHPACHLARRDWDLRVTAGAPTRVELVLDAHR
ncbi:MAG TPA: thioredoxin-like domain-containing protein [Mycobacteriales bacterium]|nr:thioredoxin-like domain-containing protein [Mycobacteriales bacterium]